MFHAMPGAPRQRASRGTLSRELILATAVEVIERDPQLPITMERIASALGVRTMSLYTHVRNREDLVEGAIELSFASWTTTTVGAAGWEDEVRAWCRALGEHGRRFSPLVREMAAGGSFQPALLEKIALLIRSLRRAGLDDRAIADAVRWIPQTVFGAIRLELTRPTELQSAGDESAAIFRSLHRLDAAARDDLLAILPHFTAQSLDELFEYTLDRLIDGLRSQATVPTADPATPAEETPGADDRP
jgi:AcrR family transcriptional regulator